MTRITADPADQNARRIFHGQNARIKHNKVLARLIRNVIKADMELFKQFMDQAPSRGWPAQTFSWTD